MKKTAAMLLKLTALLLAAALMTVPAACSSKQDVSPTDAAATASEAVVFPADQYEYKYRWYATLTPEQTVSTLTLEQKAAQMVQPILYKVYSDETQPMRTCCYGSIYGDEGKFTADEWRGMLDEYQRQAIESEAGIPYLVAQDDVHGVGYCVDAVYFPHNIGQGAANDEELCYQAGLVTAEETRQCHMIWNLYPCVAQSSDPRWGRNYECYGSDLDTIKKLSTAYTKGLIDGGVIATAKHYFGDGNAVYGTGEKSDYPRLIDRGDARLSDAEIAALLDVYQAQIDAGAQVIMISYSSLNGTKMHENKEYIMKLRDEMGFEGVIMSDSMAVQNTSPKTFDEQVVNAVDCGIDLLMEGLRYDEARQIIVDAVKDGRLSEDRVNDAVTRIIRLKKDAGVFDDPFCEQATAGLSEPGSAEHRAIAEKLVEKSLVLLKNENETLPLREGTKVYITGPACDNARAQCGGWTMGWNQSPTKSIKGVATIQKAFEQYAEDYGIEVITDPDKAKKADVVLLCVGEDAYAEWNGDTEDLALCGSCGFKSNRKAIDEAKALGKPTVACIVAGRQVIIDEEDFGGWDSAVMCYLPGSEGKGISDVLCGCADFTGRLPEPWYGDIKQIGTNDCRFKRGYGLDYGAGFTPREEPGAAAAQGSDSDDVMSGTGYTPGVFENGVYTSGCADISFAVPEGFVKINNSSSQYLTACKEEKDKTRESARTIDMLFMRGNEYILISFLNTKLGFPDKPNCAEKDYLDDFKEFTTGAARTQGFDPVYGKRTEVDLGGKGYLRDVYSVETNGKKQYSADYARIINDRLMCAIEIGAFDDDLKSPEYYEGLFK